MVVQHRSSKWGVAFLFCAALLLIPLAAYATNGYFSGGFGTKAKGLGGAAAALPQDSLASGTNPAAMVRVEERWDAGGGMFNPNRQYSYTGNSPFFDEKAQTSDADQFIIPHFGIKYDVGDDALGVAVYGNGGMNTTYPEPVFAGGVGETGVDLAQLFVNVSYALDVGPVALGVSGILAHQRFEAKGLQPFDNGAFSAAPGKVTNNGVDSADGLGARLGIYVEAGSGFAVGAAYQPEMDMDPFAEYAGLFAEQGDFDIPSHYVVGVAWQGGPWAAALDFLHIAYTDVASVSNPGPTVPPAAFGGPAPFAEADKLGGDNGFGFAWQDIDVIKLGAAYDLNADWTLRAGLNVGEQPIPETETFFNILAPGVMEEHVALGFTVALGTDSELSVAFTHALENTVSGPHPTFLGGGTTELTMDQNELEVSFGMKL